MARFLWSLVTPRQAIAGLEISETCVRIVLLDAPTKKHPFITLRAQVHVPLSAGVVTQGIVRDTVRLGEAVQKARSQIKTAIRYVILSIPADQVHTEVRSFPKSIRPEKLTEAINLSTHLELPFPFEEAYVDSEQRTTKDAQEAIITSARQSVIQAYIKAVESTGLRVVAVEHHVASALRSLDIKAQTGYLLAFPEPSSLTLAVTTGMHLKTVYTHTGHISADKATTDIEHLFAYSEAEHIPPSLFINLRHDETPLTPPSPLTQHPPAWHPALQNPGSALSPSFLIAAGAASRGLIPRSQDTMPSLMAVGTEETYEYQKISVLAEFLSASTIALSLLLSIVFVGAWLFMINLQQQTAAQDPLFSLPANPSTITALQGRTQIVNQLAHEAANVITTAPVWSKLLQAIQERTRGVFITSFNFPATNAELSLVGVAQTRAELNAFKKSLSEIPFITNVQSPVTHVYQKEAIPFTVSFVLRDPQALSQAPSP